MPSEGWRAGNKELDLKRGLGVLCLGRSRVERKSRLWGEELGAVMCRGLPTGQRWSSYGVGLSAYLAIPFPVNLGDRARARRGATDPLPSWQWVLQTRHVKDGPGGRCGGEQRTEQ